MKNVAFPNGRLGYEVQWTVAVNNPVNNVRKRARKGGWLFEVPINTPDAHKWGLTQLLNAANLAELFAESTGLNTENNPIDFRISNDNDPEA